MFADLRMCRRLIPLLVLPFLLGLWPAPVSGVQDAEPFTIAPANGGETAVPGEDVTFAVVEPRPGATYVWSFGGGARPVSGAKVVHSYAAVDDFTVRLDVVQSGRQQAVGSRVVRVTPDLVGVFAADADNQITPSDQFQIAAMVRAPGLAGLTVNLGGPLLVPRSEGYAEPGDVTWLLLPDTRVAGERAAVIERELLQKPGATLPLAEGRMTLTLEYETSSGKRVSIDYKPEVHDFNQPQRIMAVTYPRIVEFGGLPPEGAGADDYYLLGNPDFSHVDDWYVRRLALEWGRRDAPWPDDPQAVATNIFRTIDALFADGDPGLFNNDYNLSRLLEDGTLSRTRANGAYICIAQTYLFTALARTLGIPAREINNAIGAPARQRTDGVWTVSWWQEAGLELWYDGAWHYFDTWLGVTDRHAYLEKNLIYQSWSAFSRQDTEFRTARGEATGMRGHNFSAWPGDPPQWSYLEESVRPGITVDGMIGDPPAAPITTLPHLPLSGGLLRDRER
jgi:hypothetical protein